MPVLMISGDEFYYEDHGEGPAIVLAHGVGGNHASWFHQVETLSRSYRVITFDHRGFGRSSDVAGLGRGGFVADLTALLDYLRIDRAVLVGQSMGGGTCLAFATAHPERCAALVMASSLHAVHEDAEVGPIMAAAREATRDLPQPERVLDAGFRAEHPIQARLYAALASFNRIDRHGLAGEWPSLTPPEAIGVGKPVLFMAGVKDPIFPVEAVRAVQARAAGSFLVEFDAGHSVFFEQPAAFSDSLLSFLIACGIRGTRRSAHSNAPGYVAP
jgi:3-oxoadipate enol-lactonase